MSNDTRLTQEEKQFLAVRLARADQRCQIRVDFQERFKRKISRRTIYLYYRRLHEADGIDAELIKLYQDARKEFIKKIRDHDLTYKAIRIAMKQARYDQLQGILAERSENMAEVTGGESGFMMLHPHSTQDHRIYCLDSRTLHELRAIEDSVARELGELNPRINLLDLEPSTAIRLVESACNALG